MQGVGIRIGLTRGICRCLVYRNIRTKEEIDKAALKKSLSPAADGRLVDVNGSVVDGVSYTEEISYSVSAEV